MKKRLLGVFAGLIIASGATATAYIASDHSHEDGNFDHGETVEQHGGGLDQCGGHMNHKTGQYHYHQRKC